MLLQGLTGASYSVSQTILIAIASPIAVNCTSIFKDFFLTFASVLLFDDVSVSFELLTGLLISFVGGVAVMVIKSREAEPIKIKQN
jgi:hypothetical protein